MNHRTSLSQHQVVEGRRISPVQARRQGRRASFSRVLRRRMQVESLEARVLLAAYDGPMPNVGADLRAIHDEYVMHVGAGGSDSDFHSDLADAYPVHGAAVLTTVRGTGDVSQLLGLLQGAGFDVVASDIESRVLEGYMPLGALEGISGAAGVVSVMPIRMVKPTDGQGSVNNEGEQVLIADYAKGLFDVDGSGVTVGVISDSVNRVGGGLVDSVASGDLPAGITVLVDGPAGSVDEGRAMLELIHDIAPGATLMFTTGAGGDAELGAAIAALASAGADLIVDNCHGLLTEPFFQDGIAAQAVTDAVAAGVTYFSSAGNRGTSGYEAPLNLKSYADPFPGLPEIETGSYHDFNGSDDITQSITLAPGETTLVFQYDDPFGAVAGDMDVWLLNEDGTAVLDAGREFSIATGEPREFLTYANTTGAPITAQLVIQLFDGAAPGRFKWIGIGDPTNPTVDEHLGVAGSLNNPHNPGHNGTEAAISVAAAWWQTPDTAEPSTSHGPVTRTLDPDGQPIALQIMEKPQLTAADGTGTSVPQYAQFFGTSAAASNAAAVAALLLSYDASLTPDTLRGTLVSSAVDLGIAGPDRITGAGLIQSVSAMLELTGHVLPLAGDRDAVGQHDTFTLVANSGDNSLLDVSLNGQFLGNVPLADVTLITIDGRAGSDTLIVDLSHGLITVPIEYEGGNGASDALVLTGDPGVALNGTYTTGPSSATGHGGVISYNDGAMVITFTGLEPVEDLVPAASLVIVDGADANVINLVDGPSSSVPDPITGVSETTYEVNFAGLAESIRFRNKDVVTVNAADGADIITVDIGARSTADSLGDIILNGEEGVDSVTIEQATIGTLAGAMTVNGGDDNDQVLITSTVGANRAMVTDAVAVNGGAGAGNTLVIDDQANTTADTWTVTGTSVTRPAFGGVTYAELASVTLLAQNAVGAITNIDSTSTATLVDTGGGNDTVNVGLASGSLASIAGNLTVVAATGTDVLLLWDNGRVAPASYSIDAATVLGPNAGAISYTGIESLTLEAGANADTIHVAPSLDTAYTIHGRDPVFFATPGDHLIVDLAGPGSGTLQVDGPGAGTITFGGGYETVVYTSIEDLDAINGALDVPLTGDATGNEFRLALDPTGEILLVTLDGVLLLAMDKDAINTLVLSGLGGDDTLIVDGENGLPTLAGTFSAGYDNPNIPGAPSVLFDGGGDLDRILFEDLGAGFDQTYAIGDGVGGGLGIGTSEGEVLTAVGADSLQLYFVGLEPVLNTSVGGDTLTVIGDPNANVIEVVPSPALAGGTRIQETAGPYESFDFAAGAFANVRIFGHDGADLIDLIGLGADEAALASILLDGRQATLADDDAADTLRVRTNTREGDGGGVAVQLQGGGGDDLFQLYDDDADVDGLLGSVTVDGNAGNNTLVIDDTGSAGPSETVTVTATTIAGITGMGGTGGLISYVNLNAGRLEISANDAGHTFYVVGTAAGLTETELNTGGGNDDVTIDSDPGDVAAGTANGVVSPIDLNVQGGDDTLTIVDLSDATDNQFHMNATEIGGGGFGAAVTPGGIFGPDGILFYAADLEAIELRAGDGANELNVDVTGVGGAAPIARVVLTDGDGGSVFNIQADQLAAGADHTFNGGGGPDVFNVFLPAGAVVSGNTFQINGQAVNGDSNSRDSVNVLDGGGARDLTVTYQSGSSGDVIIEIDAGTPLDIRTTEEVLLAGDLADDDVVGLFGTTGDDDLTVAPLSASEVLVFLNGNPWDGPLDPATFATAYPGVAGGGAGPDILIQGLVRTGLTVDGNGAISGDQLFVYAASEQDLIDPATTISPFGLFDPGVIIPGWGAGNAYDNVSVADWIVVVDNAAAGLLVDVNIDTASFVQIADDTVPGLIVNAGSEAAPAVTGIADDIVAVQSYDLAIRVNGGDPVPAFAPEGDRLTLVTPGEVNVFSDKSVPPVVTITTSDPDTGALAKELSWSSIENVVLTPGLTSQTVNLIGDNNDPEVDQNDNFVVVGADVDSTLPSLAWLASNPVFNPAGAVVDPRFEVDTDGDNEFYLLINGSAPIAFRNVVFLNVFGDDQNPAPGVPSVGPNDIDTLDLTPYADNTPSGWGIDVRFDEGHPVQEDGEQADLLIYHTALNVGVSEDIVIQPSIPEGGELRATNGAFGTPIVAISYTNNLDIIVLDDDGGLSDTDTLLLRGTDAANPGASGDERIVADFSAAGDVANPLVEVRDAAPPNPLAPILYRVRNVVGFDTVTLDTLGGTDSVSVIGRADGSLLVSVLNAEEVILPGTAGGADIFQVVPGASDQSGEAQVQLESATAMTAVQYSGTTRVSIDNGAGGNELDLVSVFGTQADNAIALVGVDPLYACVSVDAYPIVALTNLGTASKLSLSSLGGDDVLSIAPVVDWLLNTIIIDGGMPSAGSDKVEVLGTAALDEITYYPTGANTGLVEATTGATSTYYTLLDVEELVIDGRGGNDSLTIAVVDDADTVVVTPDSMHDAGWVQVDSLLALRFSHLGAGGEVMIDGLGGEEGGDLRALVYNGTAGTDTFTLQQATVYLDARVPVRTVGIEAITMRGLGGDDSFNVVSQADISVLVQGDEPSGSDTLNYVRDVAGAALVTVSLDADVSGVPFVQTIAQEGYGVVTHTGVEHVNLDVENGELVVNGTRAEDVIEFTPLSADSGALSADHIPTLYLIDDVPPATPLIINGGAPGPGGSGTGGFADKVIYHGTSGADLIRVDSADRTASLSILGFGYPPPVLEQWRAVTLEAGIASEGGVIGTIEVLEVRSGDGGDTIWASAAENVGNGLYVLVDGGSARASDALVITDFDEAGNPIPLGADDFVVVGQSRLPDAGNVLVFQGGVRRPDIAYENVEIVSPNVASGDNLLVLGPDMYESNEYAQTAAYLGAGNAINVQNLAIFPHAFEHLGVPADNDYFRIVAVRTGLLEVQVYFHMYDPAVFPAGGDLNVELVDTAGNVVAGTGVFGNQDTTPDARLRIPVVAGQSYYVHVFGASDEVVNGYDMTILNTTLPVPYDIELVDLPVDPDYDTTQDPPAVNSDTGRSHFDNVTADNSPGIVLRLDDGIFLHDLPGNDTDGTPPDELIPVPFNPSLDPASTVAGYRVAVFIEGEPLQTGVTPQTVIGYAQPGPVDGVYVFDFDDAIVAGAVDLLDGSHFISAKVEITDPNTATQRGYGDRSQSLEVVIDTIDPTIELIDMVDDLECPFAPDNVTNDTTWSFYGYAEANAIVRIYLDLNDNGTLEIAEDLLLGHAVAQPYDGNNQFPSGYYEFASPLDLNDPSLGLPYDGLRTILATAEDLAGNVTPEAEAVVFANFLDTQGPQILSVVVTNDPTYDLFDPKPSTDGPSPLVTGLTIQVRDLPNRVAPDFLYPALQASIAVNPGHYLLVGDANGIIPIESVTFVGAPVLDGQPATGRIQLTFADPLPDDRYTLTISDNVTDPVCNNLDGESNADEPHEVPLFPSGDRVPGTDFVGRFTIDSRPEIGSWAAGNVWIDTNGNRYFDPDNVDHTNRDIVYALGFTSDDVFAGNFVISAAGTADGFDKLAVYGRVGTAWRWLIDTDNDGLPNDVNIDGVVEQFDALNINGLPVAGNFDGNAVNGDEVGVFTGTTWYFDTNHDFQLNASSALATPMRGYPIVGDYDGDGADDLATWMDDTFQIDFADDGLDGKIDVQFRVGYIGPNERPVTADFDRDGIDDLGLWVPNRTGVTPRAGSEWYLLLSDGNHDWLQSPAESAATRLRTVDGYLMLEYAPVPFGPDQYAQFGDEFALPIVGNFDPPVTGSGGGLGNLHTNLERPLDVNDDGAISPIDALIPINQLNLSGAGRLYGRASSQPFVDVNMDGFLSPLDPLRVINYLNQKANEGEGEGAGLPEVSGAETTELLTATSRWTGELAWAALPGLRRDSAAALALTTTVETGVADPLATVAACSLSVGYLPFSVADLGNVTVDQEALREYLESVDGDGGFDAVSADDLLAAAAVAVRDEELDAVDDFFQRWGEN